MPIDFFNEEFDESEITEELIFRAGRINEKNKRAGRTMSQHLNNLAPRLVEPTEEGLEMRQIYLNNFPLAHREIFTASSGIKPLGPVQVDSANHSHRIITHGGRLIKLEPRGFGKTTRSTNETLLGVLGGSRSYALIISSSATKALEIIDSILGELLNNTKLYQMFPKECEAFIFADSNPSRARYQHIDGEKTYITVQKDKIIFPIIEGSAASGAVIQVKPKDNVRGTIVKVKEGPMMGKVLRPDLIIMDDLQTDVDAANPRTVAKIVRHVKKSIMRSGGHSRSLAAMFTATPIQPGDVPHHFYFNERSWEVVSYKMLTSLPRNMDWWLGDYKNTLMNFDRRTPGSRTQARLDACKLYKDNWDMANEGAEASWEWAYEWDDDPPTELSAVQHAMNILIEEGIEVFESECQTKLEDVDSTSGYSRCPKDIIVSKQTNRPRMTVPLHSRKIVTHVDVQGEFLCFMTVSSPNHFEPEIINYGIWPQTHRLRWEKRSLEGMAAKYPGPLELRIYQAVIDFTNILAEQEFMREDGVPQYHDLILVDTRWQTEEVNRALRDSKHANLLKGHFGQGVNAKDKPMSSRTYSKACRVHHYCVTIPSPTSRQEALHSDINFFKTKIHDGFRLRLGLPGSISVFKEEYKEQHQILADHLWSERPREDYFEKEKRKKVLWSEAEADNELLDNLVGCCAGLMSMGVIIQNTVKQTNQVFDMEDYFSSMKDS